MVTYNGSNSQKTKKIVFVFLVLTLVSSLSTVSFLTNNMNFAFASQKDDSSGSGDEGSDDKSSTDNTDVGTTTGGSDDSNSGSSGGDSGSTNNTPPSTKEETTTSSSSPSVANQKTCPDGSTPDANGNCPVSTSTLKGFTTNAPTLVNPGPSNIVPNGTSPRFEINCPSMTPIFYQGKCVDQLPVIGGSTTGSGGGFIQMMPIKPDNNGANSAGGTSPSQYVSAVDGKCPAGSREVGGSSGNAGQPGTGSIICRSDNPSVTSPPATTPTDNPPASP